MSTLEWVAVVVLGVTAVGIVALTVALVLLLGQVTSTVRGVTDETLGILGGLNETVSGVNVELARVDAIVAGVQNITATADSLVGVLHTAVSNPLIKVVAYVAGATRGAKKLKG